MGSCASLKTCEGCNISEYNQSFDFKIASTTAEKKIQLSKNSIDLLELNNEGNKSWWNFEKLLDSDKSWEFKESVKN